MIHNDDNFRDHVSLSTQQEDRKSHKPLEIGVHGAKLLRMIYEGTPAIYEGQPAFVEV